MDLILKRYNYTRDVCRGTLRVEGRDWASLNVLEASLPRDLTSYINHALPPGDYEIDCEERPVEYKGGMIRIPWMRLANVKWFPKALIVCDEKTDFLPRCGQIFLGKEYTDNDFALLNPDNEAMKVWARLSAEAYHTKEPVTLHIEHDPELFFIDTYRDKARDEADERRAIEQREMLLKDIYQGWTPEASSQQ